MSDIINVADMPSKLITNEEFGPISKVIIDIDNENYYEAGDDTGRTLEFECPWGTQAMANNILSYIGGFQYKPFEASEAIIDPAAELGDGINIGGIYSGLYKQNANYGALSISDVAAPGDEELDHEYPYKPSEEKKLRRKLDAKGGSQPFSWELTPVAFLMKCDGDEVFRCDANGIEIKGDARISGSVYANAIVVGSQPNGDDAGYVTSSQMGDNSISGVSLSSRSIDGSSKIAGYSIGNNNMANDSISYSNYDTAGKLNYNQVQTNAANIQTINGYFTGTANFRVANIQEAMWYKGRSVAIYTSSGKDYLVLS